MSKKVLYVEDNASNRLLVQRIVEAEGLHFLAAIDGQTGWTTAVAHCPDLIFMDLHLPGHVSGLDLTQQLKTSPHLRHIPIVILTAFGHAEAETAALQAGCNGFLHKPADIRQIRHQLTHYLGELYPVHLLDTAVHLAYI